MVKKANLKKPSGTREWAEKTVNCCTGCIHDCLYCYAKSMAVKFKQVRPGEWARERIRDKDVYKKHPKYPGRVMFPSSHDITESNRNACEKVIDNLIEGGNEVLIVSKPHYSTVEALCSAFRPYRGQLQFRFSIGSCDDNILRFWEPNAPPYAERSAALEYAFRSGFVTSVSMEPLLDPRRIDFLINDLMPWVTDSIWIGKMNHIKKLLPGADSSIKQALLIMEAGQTDDKILKIYDRHKYNPKIKWKSSIREVVGM
jgi:DNA repair photolyase